MISSKQKIYSLKKIEENNPLYKKARHQFYLVTYRKNKPGQRPRCGGCQTPVENGLCPEIYARYKCKTFTTAKACYYHISNACMKVPAKHTDLPSTMPKTVRYFGVSAADLAMAKKSFTADFVQTQCYLVFFFSSFFFFILMLDALTLWWRG